MCVRLLTCLADRELPIPEAASLCLALGSSVLAIAEAAVACTRFGDGSDREADALHRQRNTSVLALALHALTLVTGAQASFQATNGAVAGLPEAVRVVLESGCALAGRAVEVALQLVAVGASLGPLLSFPELHALRTCLAAAALSRVHLSGEVDTRANAPLHTALA